MGATACRGAREPCRPVSARPALVLAVVLAAAVLAGCQSSAVTQTLGTAAADTAAPAEADKQVFGTGPVAVALFVDRVADERTARDQSDGAALAVKDLGADQIALTVFDLKGNVENLDPRAGEALVGGAKLFIGPAAVGQMSALRQADRAKRPPVIMLAPAPTAPAPGVFALVSDEIDSAVEAVGYAAGTGRTTILAVASTPLTEADAERLKRGIEANGAALAGVLDTAGVTAEPGKALAAKADAVLLLGGVPQAARAALNAAGALRPGTWVLGTFAWPREVYADPALDGAFIAGIDRNGFQHISDRFRAAYGRTLSAEAAYGYDAIAVGAGIVRAEGAGEIAPAALQAPSGFAGATGTFRFGADGRVERRFSIYLVKKGALVLHDAAQDGF